MISTGHLVIYSEMTIGPRHGWQKPIALSHSIRLFTGDDSVAGANFCASAALDAGIGIDHIDVTLGDSFNGAVGKAGAASDTFVCNYVSHSSVLFEILLKDDFQDAKIIICPQIITCKRFFNTLKHPCPKNDSNS